MDTTTFIIRGGIALTMLVFGINQMMSPQDWLRFIPAPVLKFSPIKPETIMRFHALGNIVFGLLLVVGALNVLPTASVWIAAIWWASIVPAAFKDDWTVGMRDLSITLALIALLF